MPPACFAPLLLLVAAPAGLPADPPFDKFVPPAALQAALVGLRPADLTATAEGLLVGQKAVGRERAGVPLRVVVTVGVRAAVGRKDAASLGRLEAVARAAGLADLATAAGLGKSASRGGPAPDPAVTAALDRIDPDDFAAFRAFLSSVQTARTLADRDALLDLQQRAKGMARFAAPLRTFLSKAVADALEAVPADAPPDADLKAAAALKKAAETPVSTTVPDEAEPKKKDAPPAGGKPKDKAKGFPGLVAAIGSAPDELTDPGFAGKFDLAAVGAAYAAGDAGTPRRPGLPAGRGRTHPPPPT